MKYYSNTTESIVLRTICSLVCFLSFFTLRGNESSFSEFFAEVNPQEKIEYFEEECKKITFGEIKSQEYISKLNEHERFLFEIELKKAKNLFQVLKETVNFIKDNQLTNNQKLNLIESLVTLRGKVLSQDKCGIGNLELSYAISMLTSGITCQRLKDKNTRIELLGPFVEEIQKQTLLSTTSLHHVLSDEFNYPNEKQETFKQIVHDILKKMNKEKKEQNSNSTKKRITSPIIVVGNYLSKNNLLQSFNEQLTKPNQATLIWDLLNSMRLEILCRMEIMNNEELNGYTGKKDDFAKKVMIYDKKVSDNEKFVFTGNETNKINLLKKLSTSQLDMRAYIKRNGLTILDMISNRLKIKE